MLRGIDIVAIAFNSLLMRFVYKGGSQRGRAGAFNSLLMRFWGWEGAQRAGDRQDFQFSPHEIRT